MPEKEVLDVGNAASCGGRRYSLPSNDLVTATILHIWPMLFSVVDTPAAYTHNNTDGGGWAGSVVVVKEEKWCSIRMLVALVYIFPFEIPDRNAFFNLTTVIEIL